MRVSEALKIAIQIADALATAHAAGIVHRDLKPGSIMVTDQGLVKVLDFGLAKLQDRGETGPDEVTLTVRAESADGSIVGTAAYMSPEQAEGNKVDARSDIFSFGAVLYEMLTGQRAFHGDSRACTMAAVLREDPKPASQLVSGLPRELERILNRCLRKDLERRSPSMKELKLELEELREESESGVQKPATATPPAKKASRYVWMGAAVVALIAILFFGRNMFEPRPPSYRLQQITRDAGFTGMPALSPDGKMLAYISDRAGGNNPELFVQQVPTGEPIQVTRTPQSESDPEFSPDGTQILFTRSNDLYVIPALGGSERLLAKDSYRGNSFSPDGRWVAFTSGYPGSPAMFGVFVLSATGGLLRQIETDRELFVDPVWPPDGTQLLVVRLESSSSVGVTQHWYLIPFQGGKAVRVDTDKAFAGFSAPRPVAWLARDSTVVFGGCARATCNIWQVSLDGRTGKLQRPPVRLTQGTSENPGIPSLRSTFTSIFSIEGAMSGWLSRTVEGDGQMRALYTLLFTLG